MCGIFCLLTRCSDEKTVQTLAENLLNNSRVWNRGPDRTGSAVVTTQDWSAYLQGFVLHLRGPEVTSQPCRTSSGGLLMWNGEIFDGVEITSHENDTAWLSEKLSTVCDEDKSGAADTGRALTELLSTIQGPWAFVYLDRTKRLWFGRDILGRRSLLWKLPIDTTNDLTSNSIILTSISIEGMNLTEVPTDGIYCLITLNSDEKLILHPWSRTPSDGELKISEIPYTVELSDWKMRTERNIKNEFNMADHSEKYPSLNGNDSEDSCMKSDQTSQETDKTEFDASGVFENVADSQRRCRDEFEAVLCDAVRKRVVLQSAFCGQCIRNRLKDAGDVSVGHCRHARVAVLFSGGIDSMMVAVLAHRYVEPDEPIDLLNVAFRLKPKPKPETKWKSKKQVASTTDYDGDHDVGTTAATSDNDVTSDVMTSQDDYMVPDRVTGLAAWEELKTLYPERRWRFFNINVTHEELRQAREDHIRHLVSPLQTVLDDSIGCAIWFAARGRGLVRDEDSGYQEETSTARVLLLGMGADEQLGGYARHRNAFKSGGLAGLREELRLDIDRISERNLGRDDRIVSDHGKEARFPFLDEKVVSFLNGLPCQYKMDLSLPRGYGEKFLLRQLAHKLGLKSCATLPKRAIQFGSRIAKLEDSKEKASDVCRRLDDTNIKS